MNIFVHKMQYCFNGITVLPLSEGEKLERFMNGLNPKLKQKVVFAPIGMGVNGKWVNVDSLMTYAILQSGAMLHGGAVTTSAFAAPAVGKKRSHDGTGPHNGLGKVMKKKGQKHQSGNGNGKPDGGVKKPFRTEAERAWLTANNMRWHCVTAGHRSADCEKKKAGAAKAPMPASYKSPKA